MASVVCVVPYVVACVAGVDLLCKKARDFQVCHVGSSKPRFVLHQDTCWTCPSETPRLYVSHNLSFCGGREGVAALGEDSHHAVREIATGHVQPLDGMGQRISLVDGHRVGDTITAAQHNAGSAAGGIEGQHTLD